MSDTSTVSWLARDPSKRWSERFVLLYSPFWMVAVAVVQLGHVLDAWGNVAYLAFGVLLAAPLLAIPLLRPGAADRGRPLRERHVMKMNLWIWIFTWSGNYFITHFFFRYMGMRYTFPTDWTFDSALGGPDSGTVPFFLYLMTHAYFATYHVVMTVLYRWVRTRFRLGRTSRALVIAAVAYLVAYAETWAMANPLLERYFLYADRDWMLSVGSSAYALLFMVSLPMFARLDEGPDNVPEPQRWSLGRVALSAMAASWLSMQLVDLWAHAVA